MSLLIPLLFSILSSLPTHILQTVKMTDTKIRLKDNDLISSRESNYRNFRFPARSRMSPASGGDDVTQLSSLTVA